MELAAHWASVDVWARLERQPGFRTMRSRRFRTLVGGILSVIALVLLGSLLIRDASGAGTSYGIDFAAYRTASLRMLQGQSPYAAVMLQGPVPAQGVDRYLYPPPLAQLLTPISVLPSNLATGAWLVVQATLLFASAWMAGGAAGARASAERLVWTGVVAAYFLPVFDSLWKGNVEGPLAFGIAAVLPGAMVGRSRAGVALVGGAMAGLAAVVKLTPLALFPALLRRGGPSGVGALVGLALLTVPSLMIAPQAWLDYARVLPNLLSGYAGYATNLAPSVTAANLGAPLALVDAVRAAAVICAVLLLAVSVGWARGSAWPGAIACAVTASLLLPAVLWFHYLAVLLPTALFAWVRARRGSRAVLLLAFAVTDVGVAALPLATLGGALLAATTIWILRPEASNGH